MVFYFFMNIFGVLYKKGRGRGQRERERVDIMKKKGGGCKMVLWVEEEGERVKRGR